MTLLLLVVASTAQAEPQVLPYAALTVEGSYDSNVRYTLGSDEVSRVAPRVGVLRLSPRGRAQLEYGLERLDYAEGTVDSTLNHRLFGEVRTSLSRRLDLSAWGRWLRADDPSVLDRPGMVLPNGRVTETAARLALGSRISRRLTLDGEYALRHSEVELADPLTPMTPTVSGAEHRFLLVGGVAASRRFDVTAGAQVQLFTADDVAEQQALAPTVGFRAALTPRLRITGDGGPAWFLPGNQVTWFARSQAIWIERRSRMALAAGRELYGGVGADRAIWSEYLYLMLTHRTSRASALRLVGGAGRSGEAPGDVADVSTLVARAALQVRLGEHVGLGLYVEHREQDADGGLAFGDLRRTLVGLRLEAAAGAGLDALEEVR